MKKNIDGTKSQRITPTIAERLAERQGGGMTEPERKAFAAERRADLPVWIRAPANGQEHYTGLTRSKLYELSWAGLIRTSNPRAPGAVKGCRLFDLASILDYLEQSVVPPKAAATAAQEDE